MLWKYYQDTFSSEMNSNSEYILGFAEGWYTYFFCCFLGRERTYALRGVYFLGELGHTDEGVREYRENDLNFFLQRELFE